MSAAAVAGLELVLFEWAGLRLAVPAAQVRALRAPRDATSPSIAALLGLEPEIAHGCTAHAPSPDPDPGPDPVARTPAAERLLEVETSDRRRFCFRVQEPVQTRFFAANALRPLPASLAACSRASAVQALAREPLISAQHPDEEASFRLIPVLDVRRLARPEWLAQSGSPRVARLE